MTSTPNQGDAYPVFDANNSMGRGNSYKVTSSPNKVIQSFPEPRPPPTQQTNYWFFDKMNAFFDNIANKKQNQTPTRSADNNVFVKSFNNKDNAKLTDGVRTVQSPGIHVHYKRNLLETILPCVEPSKGQLNAIAERTAAQYSGYSPPYHNDNQYMTNNRKPFKLFCPSLKFEKQPRAQSAVAYRSYDDSFVPIPRMGAPLLQHTQRSVPATTSIVERHQPRVGHYIRYDNPGYSYSRNNNYYTDYAPVNYSYSTRGYDPFMMQQGASPLSTRSAYDPYNTQSFVHTHPTPTTHYAKRSTGVDVAKTRVIETKPKRYTIGKMNAGSPIKQGTPTKVLLVEEIA